jgi:Rod binding domain-containing protein
MSTPDLALSSALQSVKPQLNVPSASNAAQVGKVAKDFEAVFINEFLGTMFEGIKTDGPFGGGPGEEIFRSLMLEQYSKTIADQGGFGLADHVKRQLLSMQETAG